MHAGPVIALRPVHHGSTDQNEFDVAADREQVAVRVDQPGVEPALPQGAAASTACVEGVQVALPADVMTQ